ncbi:MAG: Universal stress protein UspA [Myxococcaceae bacterium]|nr:Universal stress protein UspA [Myxococcaceae bacterium]
MRTLVIATDLGQTSTNAVSYGVKLARDLGAEVVLVHAWQPTQITVLDATIILPADRQADESSNLQHQLESVAEQHRASGVTITTRLLDGELASVIADLVASTSAEMVVVGTSLPRLMTRILGSNAQAVVRAVTCPVLVVHEPA